MKSSTNFIIEFEVDFSPFQVSSYVNAIIYRVRTTNMRNAKNFDDKKVIIYQICHSEFCHFIALSKGRIIRNASYTIIIL